MSVSLNPEAKPFLEIHQVDPFYEKNLKGSILYEAGKEELGIDIDIQVSQDLAPSRIHQERKETAVTAVATLITGSLARKEKEDLALQKIEKAKKIGAKIAIIQFAPTIAIAGKKKAPDHEKADRTFSVTSFDVHTMTPNIIKLLKWINAGCPEPEAQA